MPRTTRVVLPKLGAFLIEQRKGFRWKQAQAANIAARRGIPVSYGALRWLEEGKNQSPEPELLHAVAELYKVPFEELVRRLVKERYGLDVALASKPQPSTHAAPDTARVRELERRSEDYERTLNALSTIASELVKLAARGAEDRAPARRQAARRRGHRTAG
jgi:transcriptional regulator with XRE-family HTH domain